MKFIPLFLKAIVGVENRTPAEITKKHLRDAKLEILNVETELEMAVATKGYLTARIERLEALVKQLESESNIVSPGTNPVIDGWNKPQVWGPGYQPDPRPRPPARSTNPPPPAHL